MKRLVLLISALLLLSACSTTRVLPSGQYRLAANKVEIIGEDAEIFPSELSSYIRQQPNNYFMFGWNPFLNIYNWADPESEKWPSTMWRKIGVAPVAFDPGLIPSSKENMTRRLAWMGYYHPKIETRVDTLHRLATVHYVVNPGPRCPIDSIVYEVPGGIFGSEFKADLPNSQVKVGDYISEKLLDAECTRSADHMRNLGYYDFNKNNYFFVADTLGEKNILHYEVKEYTRNESPSSAAPIEKYHFGDVSITYSQNLKFRDDVLVKLCTLRPGMLYNEKVVNTTYSRLSALKLFNNVNVELQPRDSAVLDCNIRLGESKLQGFKVNFEASTNSNGLVGVSPQLSFYHKNIFHGGEWLNLGFNGNFQFKPKSDARSTEFGVNASLSLPRMLGVPYELYTGPNIPRTEFKASFNYQNRPEFSRRIAKASMNYSGQITDRFFFQISPISTTVVKLFNMTDDFYRILIDNPYLWDSYYDHSDIGVNAVAYYTSNSDIVPKTPFHYIRLGVDASGNVLGLFEKLMPMDEFGDRLFLGLPFSKYIRGELELGKTFRFGREDRQQLAMRIVAGAGWSFGTSDAMPFEKQFYVGGASSMRGWQARALGPGYQSGKNFFTIPSQTGDYKFEADMEYRFSLFWKLEGATFLEAGNVWMYDNTTFNVYDMGEDSGLRVAYYKSGESMLGSIASDWGLGLRVNLDFILLRLDAGFKLYEPSRLPGNRWLGPAQWFKKDGFAIHFGVGYPF